MWFCILCNNKQALFAEQTLSFQINFTISRHSRAKKAPNSFPSSLSANQSKHSLLLVALGINFRFFFFLTFRFDAIYKSAKAFSRQSNEKRKRTRIPREISLVVDLRAVYHYLCYPLSSRSNDSLPDSRQFFDKRWRGWDRRLFSSPEWCPPSARHRGSSKRGSYENQRFPRGWCGRKVNRFVGFDRLRDGRLEKLIYRSTQKNWHMSDTCNRSLVWQSLEEENRSSVYRKSFLEIDSCQSVYPVITPDRFCESDWIRSNGEAGDARRD